MAVSTALTTALNGIVPDSTGATELLADLASIDVLTGGTEASTTALITTGTYSSEASKGITLSATNKRPVSFLFDDADAAITGDVRAVLSRVAVIANHTGALTLTAIRGQVKFVGGIDFDADYVAGVQGYLEIAGATDFTLNSAGHAACAFRARIEVAGNVTVDTADTYLAGVFAELNTTGAYTVTQTNSFLSAFVAAVTDQKNDKWGSALFAKGEAVDMGVYIGEHGNTAGDGVSLGGVTAANRFHSDDGGAALTGNRRGVLSRLLITAEHTGAATLTSLTGQTKLYNGVDFDADYCFGLWGYLELDGACDFALNAANHAAGAIRARVEIGGNVNIETADTFLCGVYAELNTTGAYTVTQTGELAAFVAIATDQKNDNWGSVLYIDGADHFAKFKSGTAYEDGIKIAAITHTAGNGNADGVIKIDCAGTTYYVPVYAAGSIGGE